MVTYSYGGCLEQSYKVNWKIKDVLGTVDFEKVYYSPHDRQEIRREKYTGNFVFVVKDQVSNAMIPVNPLGFTITYFREDQAFQQ